jgi:hypothetical protein
LPWLCSKSLPLRKLRLDTSVKRQKTAVSSSIFFRSKGLFSREVPRGSAASHNRVAPLAGVKIARSRKFGRHRKKRPVERSQVFCDTGVTAMSNTTTRADAEWAVRDAEQEVLDRLRELQTPSRHSIADWAFLTIRGNAAAKRVTCRRVVWRCPSCGRKDGAYAPVDQRSLDVLCICKRSVLVEFE